MGFNRVKIIEWQGFEQETKQHMAVTNHEGTIAGEFRV